MVPSHLPVPSAITCKPGQPAPVDLQTYQLRGLCIGGHQCCCNDVMVTPNYSCIPKRDIHTCIHTTRDETVL